MNHDIELLSLIYKDSDMGVRACETMLSLLKEKDNKIKDAAEDILKEYKKFKEKSQELLQKHDENYSENSFFAKLMSDMGIKKEVKADNSDSAMASMLIEGLNLGAINTEKKVKDYESKVEEKTLDLAKNFLKFHEDSINKLKSYL